jgi:DNA-binding transcriptional ArsR family regulator
MAYDLNKFFKAISDRNRVQIMKLLNEKDMNVTEIGKHFNMKQPSISHHLNILKNAGVVKDKKVGQEVFYSLNQICIVDCCNSFQDMFGDEP